MANYLELRRQMFHALLGVAIVLGVIYGLLTVKRLLLVFIIGVILSGLSTGFRIPVIGWFLERFDRKGERIPGKGAVFFVLGSILVLALFPQSIALAGIMILALGDSLATIVGLHLGKVRSVNRKSMEGFFAGVTAAFIGAMLFVDYISALAGSLAAMCLELLEVRLGSRIVDDNIMVPMVAASVMWILTLF